jgi:hypothetical protein
VERALSVAITAPRPRKPHQVDSEPDFVGYNRRFRAAIPFSGKSIVPGGLSPKQGIERGAGWPTPACLLAEFLDRVDGMEAGTIRDSMWKPLPLFRVPEPHRHRSDRPVLAVPPSVESTSGGAAFLKANDGPLRISVPTLELRNFPAHATPARARRSAAVSGVPASRATSLGSRIQERAARSMARRQRARPRRRLGEWMRSGR